MRLIDADALIENLLYDVALDEKILDDMDFVGSRRELVQFDKDCKQNTIDLLRDEPTIEPERLTDDDFETIRIHLNAYKENLCNQQRWKEAEEYQRIIDRFMAFVSAEPRKGKWIDTGSGQECSECHEIQYGYDTFRYFCAFCGADMRGEEDED